MKFAVIAAGDGSRLASEGVSVPKPLAEVKGEKLIDRLIRIFMDNDGGQTRWQQQLPAQTRLSSVRQPTFPPTPLRRGAG